MEGPINGFIANCASDNCENHQNLDGAIDKCLEESSCTGVVQIVTGQSIYQLRSDKKLRESPRGEVTWVKLCGDKALNRIKEIAVETYHHNVSLMVNWVRIFFFSHIYHIYLLLFDIYILQEIVQVKNVKDIIISMMQWLNVKQWVNHNVLELHVFQD